MNRTRNRFGTILHATRQATGALATGQCNPWMMVHRNGFVVHFGSAGTTLVEVAYTSGGIPERSRLLRRRAPGATSEREGRMTPDGQATRNAVRGLATIPDHLSEHNRDRALRVARDLWRIAAAIERAAKRRDR